MISQLYGGAHLLLMALVARPAFAHEVRPAYLEIVETAPEHYSITWKQPVMGDLALRLTPYLSNDWLDTKASAIDVTPSFLVKTWDIAAPGEAGLEGERITIKGLEHTITDVLVNIRLMNSPHVQEVLKPSHPSIWLPVKPQQTFSIPAYLALGVEHILAGADHLLFVLGLMLLVDGRWLLIKTITAFTIAHSITLVATALNIVRVQSAIVEALVAMSIVLLAGELVGVYRGRGGVSARYPWLIAVAFGLLHGFAFAGALADIGLPQEATVLSLFLFNVGVEIGQLLFMAVVLSTAWCFNRGIGVRMPDWTRLMPLYGMGTVASYWFMERLTPVFAL